MWLSFFGRNAANETAPGPYDHMFRIYVHQDPSAHGQPRARLRHPLWSAALLPRKARVPTNYKNGSSLELARLALMAYAFHDDDDNYKFLLVSESCVPLHPLAAMHSLLTRDMRPRIHEIPDMLNPSTYSGGLPDKSRGKRWVPSLKPLLPASRRGGLLQHRQFVVAGRAEVEHYPPASEVAALFGPMSRAEEHAFYNLLVYRLGYRRLVDLDIARSCRSNPRPILRPWKTSRVGVLFASLVRHPRRERRSQGCVTYQRFNQKREGYRAPLSCRTTARGLEIEREADILRAKQVGCLFVRKMAPTCDLSCFASSGFERFQCENTEKQPVRDEPCLSLPEHLTTSFSGGCRR